MKTKHIEQALDDIELLDEFEFLGELVDDLMDSPERFRRMNKVLEEIEDAEGEDDSF
jgi:hypothetical protein